LQVSATHHQASGFLPSADDSFLDFLFKDMRASGL